VKAFAMRSAVLVAALFAALVATPAFADETAWVPAAPGIEVHLQLLDALTSKTAHTGQKFAVETIEAATGPDGTVIPAGTRGEGTVIFARKKGGGGRTGALDLRVDWVQLPQGRIKLSALAGKRGTDRRDLAVGMQLAFGLIGFLATQGTEVVLPVGSPLTAQTGNAPVANPATTTAATAPEQPVVAPVPTTAPAPASDASTGTEANTTAKEKTSR
jgi:hypothetical protein